MTFQPINLCLVSDAEAVRMAVRLACPPPHTLTGFSLSGLLDERQALSDHGQHILAAAAAADAVLVNWVLEQAPLLNTLCYHVRQQSEVPVFALCAGGGQIEMVAGLAAGVDEVLTFPLYLPLLQAKVAAYHRHAKAVRRGASEKLEKRLKKARKEMREAVKTRLDEHVEELEEAVGGAVEDLGEGAALAAAQAMEAAVEEVLEEVVEEVVEDLAEDVAAVLTPPPADGVAVLESGPLRLDRTAFRFFIDGTEVELTPKEFDLLYYMMTHAGAVCSRDQILDDVWGIDFDTGTNMVDVYMHFVRRKLSTHGQKGLLQTVRGRGYRFVMPAPAVPDRA